MSKLNINISNIKRIGAMALAIMSFSGCSKTVTSTESSQNETNSYVVESTIEESSNIEKPYVEELSINESSIKSNLTKITVVDITNGENIPGATLAIRDAKGNFVKTFVTTKEPYYVELEPGKYTLEEVESPKGYDSQREIIEFQVAKSGKTIVKMINEPLENEKTYSYSMTR